MAPVKAEYAVSGKRGDLNKEKGDTHQHFKITD